MKRVPCGLSPARRTTTFTSPQRAGIATSSLRKRAQHSFEFRSYSSSASTTVKLNASVLRNKDASGTSSNHVLVLHGLYGSSLNWRTPAKMALQKLDPAFDFHLLDLRNHGSSPQSDVMNFKIMAEDIFRYIDDNQLENVTLVGHSLGGRVAMEAALTQPNKIQDLVIVDIAPKTAPRTGVKNEFFLDQMANLKLDDLQSRLQADKLLLPSIPEIGIRQFLLTNLYQDESGKWNWKINIPAIRQFLPSLDLLDITTDKTYSNPTLFIGGSKSRYIEKEDEVRIKQLFPNSKLTWLEGGHWIHADNPKALVQTLVDFIQQKS